MHHNYLLQALDLAKLRQGFCAPNPTVGAVVVKDGQVIAQGYHWAAGHPHAEAAALAQLDPSQCQGATLYLTLEPCCHYGRTPPCSLLLIQRGIKAVYYGFKDPNPIVAGKGREHLLQNGISCEQIPLAEIDAFYQSYFFWTQNRLPWVTAKIALSLDGKIAGTHGKPAAITGVELQKYTHQWRKRSDAILTTAKTIRQDNPQLNIRLEDETYAKPLYILDRCLTLPLQSQILHTTHSITAFHAADADVDRKKDLESAGIRCISLTQEYDKLSLVEALQHIGKDGVHDLWVEAGGRCFQSLLQEKLLHRALVYIGFKWLGQDAQPAFIEAVDLLDKVQQTRWQIFGQDVVCELQW
jgi:diaminohydroxyphosphoribosylaminopyrimidine deaminase/5-amino-6-(5-phosphoribosylamino)uracil reductase